MCLAKSVIQNILLACNKKHNITTPNNSDCVYYRLIIAFWPLVLQNDYSNCLCFKQFSCKLGKSTWERETFL